MASLIFSSTPSNLLVLAKSIVSNRLATHHFLTKLNIWLVPYSNLYVSFSHLAIAVKLKRLPISLS
jgi:hypothetical protein